MTLLEQVQKILKENEDKPKFLLVPKEVVEELERKRSASALSS